MAARTVYLLRHGAADAWGQLTDEGREQSRLIGQRLARSPSFRTATTSHPHGWDSSTATTAAKPMPVEVPQIAWRHGSARRAPEHGARPTR